MADRLSKGIFVKGLRVVLVYRFFITTNHRLQETKVLEFLWTQKHNLKALKVELLFSYKKTFRFKSLNMRCCFVKNNFTRTQEPVFLVNY